MNPIVFAFGAPGKQEMVVIAVILLSYGAVIWGIIHCIRNKKLSDTNRVIGVVLMVVLGIIGLAIYPFLPRTPERQ